MKNGGGVGKIHQGGGRGESGGGWWGVGLVGGSGWM